METCYTCRSLFGLLSTARRVLPNRAFSSGLGFVCSWFKLNTPKVCKGLINTYDTEIHYMADQMDARKINAEEACTLVFGSRCGTLSSPLHIWSLNITDAPTQSISQEARVNLVPTKAASDVRILHISDTHFDPEYKVS